MCRDTLWLLRFLSILFSSLTVTESGKVQMRIVRETSSYGYFGHNFGDIDNRDQLIARVSPSNFSGPSHFRSLLGLCYNTTIDKYRFVFCPFQNITQYEVSQRWNAYQGILGVWSHWHIENNTFAAMVFSNGDYCGKSDRSVKVNLHCGPNNILANVTEPTQCMYVADFVTKLACHKDALLVYPRLSYEMQKRWDHLWTELHLGYITEKGCNSSLLNLFQEAGLTKQNVVETNTTSPSANEDVRILNRTFSDLDLCNKEYLNLKSEVLRLNQELESLISTGRESSSSITSL